MITGSKQLTLAIVSVSLQNLNSITELTVKKLS